MANTAGQQGTAYEADAGVQPRGCWGRSCPFLKSTAADKTGKRIRYTGMQQDTPQATAGATHVSAMSLQAAARQPGAAGAPNSAVVQGHHCQRSSSNSKAAKSRSAQHAGREESNLWAARPPRI